MVSPSMSSTLFGVLIIKLENGAKAETKAESLYSIWNGGQYHRLPCETDQKLRQLVDSIRTGLVVPMRAHGGKTPTEVTPSPRPGVEDSIEPITRWNPQLQLRRHCLERDGNKCLATGYYSFDHDYPPNAPTAILEAAHIIPFALGSSRASDGEAVNRHASIWVNLRRYFPVLREMSFTSEQVNSEKNMMMLEQLVHKQFGQFNIVFEAAGVPHQYRIKAFPGGFRQMYYGEIIDKILRDFGDCGGLAPDGGTNLEDLLAVSSLSLLRTNVNETQ
ncbi:hypothetical protein N7535_001926 [Penicillium sp. DV-2018c]|nr:hypothetical protein N7535_001926 [Penicillium sp. DV-2018c]